MDGGNFGDLFDFNGDGELDDFERAVDNMEFDAEVSEEEDSTYDDDEPDPDDWEDFDGDIEI